MTCDRNKNNRINGGISLGAVSVSVDNEFAAGGVPSIDQLCDGEDSGGNSGAEKE
jgi:hypothetical protein